MSDSKSNKILMVCVDGSPHSMKAFDSACYWKRPNDTLFVVHAVETVKPVPLVGGPGPIMLPVSEYTATNEALKKEAQKLMARLGDKCAKKGMDHVMAVVLTTGNPKVAVVQYAQDKKVDMIFVGTRGLGAVSRFFLDHLHKPSMNTEEALPAHAVDAVPSSQRKET